MEREHVTKFDLDAAFKALDDIAFPDVSGKGRFTPNRVNLRERLQAKHAHEVLVEDYFDVSMEEDLTAAEEQREAEVAKAKLARIEKIVDLDAESEEDILPSYVGKVIMQCPQCMTLFYKNEEDIEKSEETPDVVNINEICQHCGNANGYTLVGKVGNVEEDEMSNFEGGEELSSEAEDDLDLEFPEEGTEEVDAEGTGDGAEEMSEEELSEEDFDLDLDLEDTEEETNESLHGSKLLDKIEDKNDLKTDIESDHLTLNEEAVAESVQGSKLLQDIEKKNDLKTEIESEHLTLNETMEEDDTMLTEAADVRIFIDQSGSLISQKDELLAQAKKDYTNAEANIEFFDDAEYAGPRAAAEAGENVVLYTNADYKTNCPELDNLDNVKIIDITSGTVQEAVQVEDDEDLLTEDAVNDLLGELWSGSQPTSEETEAALASFAEELEEDFNEDFDEFDDQFDQQVSEYLGEVYENVDKYESTCCTAKGKELVVEGTITFKSGKTRNTKFVFENKKRSNNELLYIGMNESFSNKPDAFRMTCVANGTKLISESFRYRYNIQESLVRGSIK